MERGLAPPPTPALEAHALPLGLRGSKGYVFIDHHEESETQTPGLSLQADALKRARRTVEGGGGGEGGRGEGRERASPALEAHALPLGLRGSKGYVFIDHHEESGTQTPGLPLQADRLKESEKGGWGRGGGGRPLPPRRTPHD